MPKTRHIYISCIYDALDNRYGFSISVRHGIDCTIFRSSFSWKVWKKMFFKIFKSWQVWDWLAKWIIMLRFIDLRWPRVFRRYNVGLVLFIELDRAQIIYISQRHGLFLEFSRKTQMKIYESVLSWNWNIFCICRYKDLPHCPDRNILHGFASFKPSMKLKIASDIL